MWNRTTGRLLPIQRLPDLVQYFHARIPPGETKQILLWGTGHHCLEQTLQIRVMHKTLRAGKTIRSSARRMWKPCRPAEVGLQLLERLRAGLKKHLLQELYDIAFPVRSSAADYDAAVGDLTVSTLVSVLLAAYRFKVSPDKMVCPLFI